MLNFQNIMKSIRMSVSPENELKEINRISRQLIASRGGDISGNLRKLTTQFTGKGASKYKKQGFGKFTW